MDDLLSRKGVSLDRLRAFLLVYEAGGIARAAPGEPVQQSQLSRQLSQLEKALGQLLLLRAGRRVIPTEAGRRLARVVRELRTGLADALEVSGGRRVRLAAGDSVLCWLLLPALRRIRADCPGIQVEIRAAVGAELVRGLDEYQLDMGLLRAGETAPALKTLRLGRISYALFAARHHRNLRSAPLAVPTTERALMPALVKLGQPTVECETFPQVAAAVRSGEVAGVLPSYARRELSEPQYHREDLPELGASNLLLAWRPRLDELRPELKAVRSALDHVVRDQLAGRD